MRDKGERWIYGLTPQDAQTDSIGADDADGSQEFVGRILGEVALVNNCPGNKVLDKELFGQVIVS